MSNVSESGGLIATVDSLFGIIQTPSMRVENIYYIKAVAIRNSGHMGDRKKYDFNQKYLRITENTEEDIIPENISLPGTFNNTSQKQQYQKQNMSGLPIQQSNTINIQP